jgi:hypothetical protein
MMRVHRDEEEDSGARTRISLVLTLGRYSIVDYQAIFALDPWRLARENVIFSLVG